MNTQSRTWIVIGLMGIILVTMACLAPASSLKATIPTATVTATPVLLAGGSNSGNISGTGGSNGGNNGGTGGSNGGNNGGNNGNGSNIVGSSTQLPSINSEPYVVKQIETLGKEVISGVVCSLTKPFSVQAVAPEAAWTFVFVPQNAQSGKVSYAYSIPKAGESHDASGTYSLTQVDQNGTLQLSLLVSDHVVFKGFDGNIPVNYKFNLVPSPNVSCPSAP